LYLKLEQALLMETSTGKRGRFFKNMVTNAREFAQLKKTLKQKSVTKPKELKYMKKVKPDITRIRC
jgi:hypothetical protein